MSFESPPASSPPAFEQRTIESFFDEFHVSNPDVKTSLLSLLTHIIYGYNQAIVKYEQEQDAYRREQMAREIVEIHDKIKRTITEALSGKGEFSP